MFWILGYLILLQLKLGRPKLNFGKTKEDQMCNLDQRKTNIFKWALNIDMFQQQTHSGIQKMNNYRPRL